MSDYANKILRHAVDTANKDYEEMHQHCTACITALEAHVAKVTAERDRANMWLKNARDESARLAGLMGPLAVERNTLRAHLTEIAAEVSIPPDFLGDPACNPVAHAVKALRENFEATWRHRETLRGVADEMAHLLEGCDAFHRTDKDDATISELLQRYRARRAG